MSQLNFTEMQNIQRALQEKYHDKWVPLSPETGRSSLLWMIVEAGEVADVIKKEGDTAVIDDIEVRHHFIEELCDVLMYFNDVMLCYSITPEELEEVYLEKHKKNMERW
ncbi:MAG: nucleotide pyrophosphohydrolase [Oscillospiraceae bacterium]|nr:nucleotide pyrophosphohydrolase [Oscillospiraceae bacterium]